MAAATAEPQAGAPKLDVRQILEKILTARGGLDAWRKVQTFLEIRYDRETRSAPGKPGVELINYRDYRSIDGLQIPMTIETGSPNGRPGDRMVIDRVLLNPPLLESEFSRPWGSGRLPPAFGAGTAPR